MIRFTIVTVCLNAGADLTDTVENTLKQTYPDFEILVKDGFSTDGSVERLPQDDRIRLVQKKDTGIYDAMNQAVEEARGDYVIFMNCGDRFYATDVLEKIASSIGEDKQGVYYGSCYYRLRDQVRSYPRTVTPMTCYRTMICHQAMVYSLSVLREHPYDLSYRIIADRELLWYLVIRRGMELRCLNVVIADYKGGGESAKPEHVKRNKADQKRLTDTYFTRGQQFQYRLLMALSLQKLRIAWAHHPRYGKYYHSLIAGLYSLKKKLRG